METRRLTLLLREDNPYPCGGNHYLNDEQEIRIGVCHGRSATDGLLQWVESFIGRWIPGQRLGPSTEESGNGALILLKLPMKQQ